MSSSGTKRKNIVTNLVSNEFNFVKIGRSKLNSGATVLRNISLPDKEGILATLSDVVSGGGDVTLNTPQTLTNKNLTSATNTFPSTLLTTTDAQTVTNKNLTSATNTFPSTLLSTTGTQTVTNKNLTSATNTFPSTLVDTSSTQTISAQKTIINPILENPLVTTDAANAPLTSLVLFMESNDIGSTAILTNKNLTSATNTFPSTLLTTTGTQTVTNKNLTSATNTFPSTLLTTTDVQTVTNKNLTSATNTFPSTFATTTASQVLTNKDLSSSTNTFPNFVKTGVAWPTVQGPGISLVDGTTVSAANQFQGVTLRTGVNTVQDTFSTAGQTNISDIYFNQRTLASTNVAQAYTNASTLCIEGPPIAGTNVTLTPANTNSLRVQTGNARLVGLGTPAIPALAIGSAGNDGIYSSAAGAVNVATAGVLRQTTSSAGLVLAGGLSVTTSGIGGFSGGSGGFSSSGPLVCTGASSVTTCALRPTNNANTGIFGTAATALNCAVGGTQILGLTSTGASVTGNLTASGVVNLNGGKRVSTIGTTTLQEVRGSVTISAVIPMGTFYNHGSVLFTGSVSFSSTPNMILTINQESGSGFWDQCSVTTIIRGITSFTIGIRNNSLSSTNGSCTVSYVAWV